MRVEGTRERWLLSMDETEQNVLGFALENHLSTLRYVDARVRASRETDPFAFWEAQFDDGADAVRRTVLPDLYRDDEVASARHHGLHDETDVDERMNDVRAVEDDLYEMSRAGTITMDPDRTRMWMRTLNTVRLVLAAQLGVTDQVSADEVARAAAEELDSREEQLYEWLGMVIEVFVQVELS